MVPVELDCQEITQIRITAARLYSHWNNGTDYKGMQTLGGLYAEFAAVKYFNYTLGATPAIEFNTKYINGGDGGFDFEFCGIKFDVKSSRTGKIELEHVRYSKADAIIGVRRMGLSERGHQFDIFGFIPVSRIAGLRKSHLEMDDFCSLLMLAKARPNDFRGEIRKAPKPSEPERLGDLIVGLFSMEYLRA